MAFCTYGIELASCIRSWGQKKHGGDRDLIIITYTIWGLLVRETPRPGGCRTDPCEGFAMRAECEPSWNLCSRAVLVLKRVPGRGLIEDKTSSEEFICVLVRLSVGPGGTSSTGRRKGSKGGPERCGNSCCFCHLLRREA